MIDQEVVGVKLETIARMTEELSAELFTDNPETAKKFGKIASYCRKLSTCLRLHGQIPLEVPKNSALRIVQSVDRIAQTVKTLVDRLPQKEGHDG